MKAFALVLAVLLVLMQAAARFPQDGLGGKGPGQPAANIAPLDKNAPGAIVRAAAPPGPVDGDEDEVLDLEERDYPDEPEAVNPLVYLEHAWSTRVLGVILIALGAFLTFVGKRWFKLFLGVSGFLSFGVLMFNVLCWIHRVMFHIPYTYWTIYALSAMAGAAGCWACTAMWEIGVLASAGYGGYTLGVLIMSLKNALVIENYLGRSAFLTVMTVAAVALAWFLDEIAIIIASALGGAVALALGIDCFTKWGFLQVVLAQVSDKFGSAKVTKKVYIELAIAAGLAIVGAVVQFLSGGGKKGYGKSDRV